MSDVSTIESLTGRMNAQASKALAAFDSVDLDTTSMPQRDLDLASRSRTSVFPWRGQFSPELIDKLIAAHARPGDVVLDPFVGSGTTLLEAARHDCRSIGSEINPAAVIMASIAKFVNLSASDRKARLARFFEIVERAWPTSLLTGPNGSSPSGDPISRDLLRSLVDAATGDTYLLSLVQNLILRLNDELYHRKHVSDSKVWSHAQAVSRIVTELPITHAQCNVFHADARQLPVDDGSTDLILTSPPYINVFNYHQNYRAATELLGWDLLGVAKSEFGANRKHRGNRFLTVIQYGLDMAGALLEFRRVLKPAGTAILVVGRESNVRGTRFENGRIVAAIATQAAGFALVRRQERKFKTKFGQLIFEDILHLVPAQDAIPDVHDLARAIGEAVLGEAVESATSDVRSDIQAALASACAVQQSPLFESSLHERARTK